MLYIAIIAKLLKLCIIMGKQFMLSVSHRYSIQCYQKKNANAKDKICKLKSLSVSFKVLQVEMWLENKQNSSHHHLQGGTLVTIRNISESD